MDATKRWLPNHLKKPFERSDVKMLESKGWMVFEQNDFLKSREHVPNFAVPSGSGPLSPDHLL